MAVQTELVKEFLVGRIHGWVIAHYLEELAPEVETALAESESRVRADWLGDFDSTLPQRIARAGYLARIAETELFEPAREPSSALAAKLQGATSDDPTQDRARVSAEAARAEPTERPDLSDARAMSWHVPGPGGHVRHYVALEATKWLAADQSDRADLGLKGCWLYGFFLRCCEEVAVPA